MDLRLEYETLGVYQDVALTSFDLLAPVLTPVFPAHSSTLYRLGIHHARAGLRIPFQANPKAFADGPVDALPGAVDPPLSEVVVDSLYANGKKVGEGLLVRLGRRNGSRPPRL